jgi:uroporphyrinogen-III synthase
MSLKHIQWIAVGQATANRLHEYGIEAHVPDVETSEGMLTSYSS